MKKFFKDKVAKYAIIDYDYGKIKKIQPWKVRILEEIGEYYMIKHIEPLNCNDDDFILNRLYMDNLFAAIKKEKVKNITEKTYSFWKHLFII